MILDLQVVAHLSSPTTTDKDSFDRKNVAVLARHKRKKILIGLRSKRNKFDENTMNHNIYFNRYNPPSKIHVRTPLSNITYAVMNERNQNHSAKTIEIVLPSTKKLNVDVNQFVLSNLLKQFTLENPHYASSLISNLTTPTSTSANYKSTITLDTMSPKQIVTSTRQRRKIIIQQKMDDTYSHHGNIVNKSNLSLACAVRNKRPQCCLNLTMLTLN